MEKQYKSYLRILIITQLLIFVTIAGVIIFVSDNTSNFSSDMLKAVSIDSSENHMRETIDNTIIRIDSERLEAMNQVEKSMDFAEEVFEILEAPIDTFDFKSLSVNLNHTEYGSPIRIIFEDSSGEITEYYQGNVLDITDEFFASPKYDMILKSNYSAEIDFDFGTVYLLALEEDIEAVAKQHVYDEIHKSIYDENEYLWVNEIVNYEGGKNYAIRVIHPNLKMTEGDFLSTDMTDMVGGFPYLEELKGINEKGEVLHTYYFKNMADEAITEKLSYAKLYEEFNWIVATGIPLEDIYTNANEISAYQAQTMGYTMLVCMIVTFAIFALGVLAIIKNHRDYKHKVESYVKSETKLDALTGALSRKLGETVLLEEFKKYIGDGSNTPLLMMLDIDNFKRVNDTYGHDVGDVVLKKVVDAATKQLDSGDSLFRWGGEEFIILCRNTDLTNHCEFAETILQAVRDVVIQENTDPFSVTISIGGSYLQEEDMGYEEALKRADEALYHSKKTGKDKYSYYCEENGKICD